MHRALEIAIGTTIIVGLVAFLNGLMHLSASRPVSTIQSDVDYSHTVPNRYVDILKEQSDNTQYEHSAEDLCKYWRKGC